ncbi:MAG: AAA family ATPase [Bacteroidales bacterium]|jgi:predicted AAA+ superfamily ATPase|nr:AAA family ATPase [Bacteroidales bacterium]
MYNRKQKFQGSESESLFLWGARQTGKSTLLKALFPDAPYFDMLKGDVYERFTRNPSILREMFEGAVSPEPVILDEIQRVPALLNEIHWLIVNCNQRFIMSGSSPRNILRNKGNLLGGRALRYELYPLVFPEIPGFDLLRALNNGLLPRHYISQKGSKLLSAYIGSYLQDEIMTEAKIRNIASFSRFLEMAAFSNGEMVNYSNIATDCGVSGPTVKEYFQILEDTLTGRFLPSFQKKPKRRVILAPKFYFFDVGVANFLLKRGRIETGSEAFGKAFEHFIYQEIYAHSKYTDLNYPVCYWRTVSQLEVDFIMGDHEVAIEVKATDMATSRHYKGLNSFAEEYKVKKLILVTNDPYPRHVQDIIILPWKTFLEKLWGGELIS